MFKAMLISAVFILSKGLNASLTAITQDASVIAITNTDNQFTTHPYFEIHSDTLYDSVWWQISSSEEFPPEAILSESVCNENTIILPECVNRILNANTAYYFRARAGNENLWGYWSQPFVFTVEKKMDVIASTFCNASKRTFLESSTEYFRNPYVSDEIWNTLSPYFLPLTSTAKTSLDRIFSQKHRVLSSRKSMIRSGFTVISHPKDKVVVAKHPYLKGYLVKAYTDDMEAPDTYWWKKRIDGVNIIQQKIIEHGYQGIMKTPKKWIYPVPFSPSPNGPPRKNFILIVEEMDILSKKKNLKAYQKQMNPQILDAFFTILMELNLIDSIYADNTPFCKDGRLAFIDTEHSLDTTRPVPISIVAKYLSPEMYVYWEQLILNGVPNRP